MNESIDKENILPIKELLSAATSTYNEADLYTTDVKTTSKPEKLKNEAQLNLFFKNFQKDMDPYINQLKSKKSRTDTSKNDAMLFKEMESIIINFLEKIEHSNLLFDKPIAQFFIDYDYVKACLNFVQTVRVKDPDLKGEEIFQALRHFWIMHSFQVFWDLPLNLSPSIYAFTLLYPYTDNIIDSPAISSTEKQRFNESLAQFLEGETVSPENIYEERIYTLLETIETEYPAASYPNIYEGIKLIHKAQIMSIKQTQGNLSYKELLDISFLKSGATVLVDNYLVKGQLSKDELHYTFQTGTLLQLLDDLTDIEEDRSVGSQTIYTKNADVLDKEIKRLISYTIRINTGHSADSEVQSATKEVIKASTFLMIMMLIGTNPQIVSNSFYKELESYSKIRLKFYSNVLNYIYKIFED